jgi:hypothetical protein
VHDDLLASPDELAALEALVDGWLATQLAGNPVVAAVEKESDPLSAQRRWYVRVHGEEKDVFSVWYTLRQRTLHYETYVMPAPEERAGEVYEQLLRRNLRFNGLAFAIGAEDALYLVGQLPVRAVDEGELDRTLGSLYAHVEQCFRPAMRLGFGARFKG